MSIILLVSGVTAQPTSSNILDYLGCIEEFTEKQMEIRVDYAFESIADLEAGLTFYSTLFRVKDVKLDSDKFYMIALADLAALAEISETDPKSYKAMKGFLERNFSYWLSRTGGVIHDKYYVQGGEHVTVIEGDVKSLDDLFTTQFRRSFTLVKSKE